MFWRVQAAWSGGLHPSFAGREEHLARREVGRLLGTWIVKNLVKLATRYGQIGQRGDFTLHANMVASSIIRSLEADDVWGAYDVFHDFLDRMQPHFDFPTWLLGGTVIVEAPAGQGPRTRKRFLTEEDFPPKEDMPPSVFMEGSRHRLGALRRWKVWWGDIGGQRHASYFVREDEALAHLATLLDWQMERLHTHASFEIYVRDPERAQYADEAIQLVFQVRGLLKAGMVSEAHELWRRFEVTWEDIFPSMQLRERIGFVGVEVE